MTLAHELQHYVQCRSSPVWWEAGVVVRNLVQNYLPPDVINTLGLKWCDIPHEREARIVSKRTAESLLGRDIVRRYIDEKIAEHVTEDDSTDWECIGSLDTSVLGHWRAAADAVRDADRLVILGYSFPKEDTYGRFFFREAMLERQSMTRSPLRVEYYEVRGRKEQTACSICTAFPGELTIEYKREVTPAPTSAFAVR